MSRTEYSQIQLKTLRNLREEILLEQISENWREIEIRQQTLRASHRKHVEMV